MKSKTKQPANDLYLCVEGGAAGLVDMSRELTRLHGLCEAVVKACGLVTAQPAPTLTVADWHGITALAKANDRLLECLKTDWTLDDTRTNVTWMNVQFEQNAALLRVHESSRQLSAWITQARQQRQHDGRPVGIVDAITSSAPLLLATARVEPGPEQFESPWDAETEARNRAIYEACCSNIIHKQIASQWGLTDTWVTEIAKEYARRHQLKPPAPRKRGPRKKPS